VSCSLSSFLFLFLFFGFFGIPAERGVLAFSMMLLSSLPAPCWCPINVSVFNVEEGAGLLSPYGELCLRANDDGMVMRCDPP
jgi:hypothetical protein